MHAGMLQQQAGRSQHVTWSDAPWLPELASGRVASLLCMLFPALPPLSIRLTRRAAPA